MGSDWHAMSPLLANRGCCVFALNYGGSSGSSSGGTAPMEQSAPELGRFIEKVLTTTRAHKVDLVGHSEGGVMPRYYIKFLGGARKVDELVGLSPSNHGTTNPLAPGVPDCLACQQQVAGSAFLRHLNAGNQTPAPVDYTVIETNHDEVVTPFSSEFLPGRPSRVTNVLLQNRCPSDATDHVGIILDPVALQLVLNSLGRPGPGDPRFRPNCTDSNADASFRDSRSVAPVRKQSRSHRPAHHRARHRAARRRTQRVSSAY